MIAQVSIVASVLLCSARGSPPIPVDVSVDASAAPAAFPHFWESTFGSGHAKLSLRSDWQAHLKQARDDLGLGGVRYHGIFDDDMGVVTAHRTYNFSLIDASWDYQLSLGLTPVVELSFMPALLAGCHWSGPGGKEINPSKKRCRTIMHYQGVTMPPTDFDDWIDLVRSLAQHAVQRYGVTKVSKWSWEVWNELWGMSFPDPYMKLFNASSFALKSVHPELRVGGPATMQLQHVQEFITACASAGIPYDFVR